MHLEMRVGTPKLFLWIDATARGLKCALAEQLGQTHLRNILEIILYEEGSSAERDVNSIAFKKLQKWLLDLKDAFLL